jgi:catechol 2,3-dioxygenase-like lactoylglutathione lyase family enzyme
MDYKLSVVRIFVTDWDRALNFYTETLEMALSFRDDAIGWAQLAAGGADLALERVDTADPEAAALIGRFVGVSLQVPDVLAAYELLLAKSVDFVGPPERQPWGGTLAHLRDPDGNVITLLGD